jgi:hypothetical protein
MKTFKSLAQTFTRDGNYLESTWKAWIQDPSLKQIKALPLLICWGIWLARNAEIFKDKAIILEVIAAQSLDILSHFPQSKEVPIVYLRITEDIDKSKPWELFDEASQNSICREGALHHLSKNHFFHIKMGLGRGTNNYDELVMLKLLLTFAREK